MQQPSRLRELASHHAYPPPQHVAIGITVHFLTLAFLISVSISAYVCLFCEIPLPAWMSHHDSSA